MTGRSDRPRTAHRLGWIAAGVIGSLAIGAALLVRVGGDTPGREPIRPDWQSVGPAVAAPPPAQALDDPPADTLADATGLPAAEPAAPEPAEPRVLYLHDIDDIKHEIYQREIDTVDRLHLLDELVQTGDMDTRELWDSAWGGVDDWKREQNGFALMRSADGSLIFHPDQATMDLYSFTEAVEPYEYDAERNEFVSEVDYYGKPIRKVIKFIKEDVAVMMVISGEKVDLNIYDKNAARNAQR